jgi:alpha-L-glutamate ligase-like protein
MLKPIKLYIALRRKGIVGINQRNSDLIMRYNKRKFYPLVDDKLTTKQLAIKAGIAVPELYQVVRIQHQVESAIANQLDFSDSFVVKPSRGSGGEGIIVVIGKAKNGFRRSNSSILTREEFSSHLTRILSGVYSLGGHPDKALIEYRVKFDPVFEEVSYLGVPDIRIIVLQGIPIMAMLRLPTRQSSGKANLHQGAVGVGISLTDGSFQGAVWKGEFIDEHPDTGIELGGILVPHWKDLLLLAAKAYDLSGLGYQGVDIVLDRDRGPMLLELNARPGLAIQMANRLGIIKRVEQVEKLISNKEQKLSAEERVNIALGLV